MSTSFNNFKLQSKSFPPRTTIFMPEQMFFKQKCLTFSSGNQNISSLNRANHVIFQSQHSVLSSLWELAPHQSLVKPWRSQVEAFCQYYGPVRSQIRLVSKKAFLKVKVTVNCRWTKIWAHVIMHFKLASYSAYDLQKSRANIGKKLNRRDGAGRKRILILDCK